MLRYGIALAAVLISTSAFAQDSHQLSINIESSSAVNVSGDVNFSWIAPIPGQEYSITPDGGNLSTVTIDYTSDGSASTIEATSDTDFESMWGITISVDASTATCGFGSSLISLTSGSNQLIDLASAGTCSGSTSIDYSAEISNPANFSAMNDSQFATITYTMF